MMTRLFRDFSIGAKLIVLMMVISCSVTALATGFFLVIEIRMARSEILAGISTLADLISLNSRAALVFDDREIATEILGGLHLKPDVKAAWILTKEGKVFARYGREATAPPHPPSDSPENLARLGKPLDVRVSSGAAYALPDHSLVFFHPIILDTERVGTLVLQATLSELQNRITASAAAAVAILLFSALAALLFASWLQRFVSRPIVDLTGVMARVSREKDYGLRLERRSEDEVGLLIAGFNDMLAQVAERDRQMEEANLLLEQRVQERTLELDRANIDLLQEIGERRQTERALRQSESSLRSLFENSPVALWSEDFSAVKRYLDSLRRSGIEDFAAFFRLHPEAVHECARLVRVLDVNQATVRMFNATSKEQLLGNLDRVFTEESFAQFQQELLALAQGRNSVEVEGINRTLDGERKFVNMRLSVVPGDEETLSRVIVSLVDLTERRKAEEALRMLAKAIETTQVGITITNLDGTIVFTNEAEARMHGYETSELVGRKANLLGPAELRLQVPAWEMQTWQRESMNMRKDGSVFPVRLVSDLVADAAGNPLAVVSVCEDITERKETEERLKASIVEKDVLLREVHHRVKNNLQIISSLLNLQLKKIAEAKTRAELNATRNRIRSMALIHEKLYQSESLSQINFAEYIEELSRQLRSLYAVSPGKVQLVLDIEAIYLDVDVAIPCGMIINELLTNALKYAFPGERSGEITVRFRAEGAEIVLSVVDDGIGLPPEIDLERVETLGFQLVRGLAQQLNGTVTIERDSGTRLVMRCPAGGAGRRGDQPALAGGSPGSIPV